MTQERVKALTISQPYASLIVNGDKFVENRAWFSGYTGTLFIHAGKGTQYLSRHDLQRYKISAILGVCKMVTCIHLEAMRTALGKCERYNQLKPEEMARISDHEHAEGPWCWVLSSIIKLPKPVPCVGAQGLWSPDGDIIDQVREQVELARCAS